MKANKVRAKSYLSMVTIAYFNGVNDQKEHDIKTLSKVYADLLSAKGYDIATINSELARLQKEIKKDK